MIDMPAVSVVACACPAWWTTVASVPAPAAPVYTLLLPIGTSASTVRPRQRTSTPGKDMPTLYSDMRRPTRHTYVRHARASVHGARVSGFIYFGHAHERSEHAGRYASTPCCGGQAR